MPVVVFGMTAAVAAATLTGLAVSVALNSRIGQLQRDLTQQRLQRPADPSPASPADMALAAALLVPGINSTSQQGQATAPAPAAQVPLHPAQQQPQGAAEVVTPQQAASAPAPARASLPVQNERDRRPPPAPAPPPAAQARALARQTNAPVQATPPAPPPAQQTRADPQGPGRSSKPLPPVGPGIDGPAPPAKFGIARLASGTVIMRSGTQVQVGQTFENGETLVGVDPVKGTVSTSARTILLDIPSAAAPP